MPAFGRHFDFMTAPFGAVSYYIKKAAAKPIFT